MSGRSASARPARLNASGRPPHSPASASPTPAARGASVPISARDSSVASGDSASGCRPGSAKRWREVTSSTQPGRRQQRLDLLAARGIVHQQKRAFAAQRRAVRGFDLRQGLGRGACRFDRTHDVQHRVRGRERRVARTAQVEIELAVREARAQALRDHQRERCLADAAHSVDAADRDAARLELLFELGDLARASREVLRRPRQLMHRGCRDARCVGRACVGHQLLGLEAERAGDGGRAYRDGAATCGRPRGASASSHRRRPGERAVPASARAYNAASECARRAIPLGPPIRSLT